MGEHFPHPVAHVEIKGVIGRHDDDLVFLDNFLHLEDASVILKPRALASSERAMIRPSLST